MIEDCNGRCDINSFVLTFFGFTVKAVDDDDERFAEFARVLRFLVGSMRHHHHADGGYRPGWFRNGSSSATSFEGWVC